MLIPILDKLINISTYLGLLVLEQNFSKIYINEVNFKGFLLSSEKKNILLIYCHGCVYCENYGWNFNVQSIISTG